MMEAIARSRHGQAAGALVLACALVACRGNTLQAYPEQLAGIGIVVKALPEGHTVTSVFADGPAASAGIEVGDRIVAIDGASTQGKSLAAIVDALRGKAGTPVVLRTSGRRGEMTTTLTRRQLAKNGGNEYRAN